MGMIFPGMDPYLESSQIWPGVHGRLVVYIGDYLQPILGPRYIAAVEERVFVEGPARDIIPDVLLTRTRAEYQDGAVAVAEADLAVEVLVPELDIHESYIEILDRDSGLQVVTVIEVLSPSNKYEGGGRDSYLAKQREVLDSKTHLVEIDLLRSGHHVLAVPEWRAREHGRYDYIVSVHRAVDFEHKFKLYMRTLRNRLPRVGIPLAGDDPDVALDLQEVLEKTYEAGRYRDRLRYDAPCVPPLSKEDQAWADGRIAEALQAEASADVTGPSSNQ